MNQPKAIVFAYSEMGVRCIAALLTQNISIELVVTHKDNPNETIWFDSVAELAQLNRINVITPENPNDVVVVNHIMKLQPDWLFSFYYRTMLSDEIILAPTYGSYNMHGSLLPKYRGRSPTNWAIVHGEILTGATLHKMVTRPDAGDIIDQEAVEILPNDTSAIVYQRTCFAAENILLRSIPKMLSNTVNAMPNEIEKGSYYGGRSREDGVIDVRKNAQDIHNLIRAVAPPYPGAFIVTGQHKLKILGSYYIAEPAVSPGPRIYCEFHRLFMDCLDGKRFEIRQMEIDDTPTTPEIFDEIFGTEVILNR